MQELYFNSAATGIVKKEFIDSAQKDYLNLCGNASNFAENWFEKEIPVIKSLVSDRFSVKESEIALIPNFSFGINVLLNALPENSNVLIYKKDYPSLVDPLEYKNFNIFEFDDVDGFEIYLETIERHISKHYIDFLLISHVQWRTGFKFDLVALSKLCKRHNVKLIVDATQSAGAIDINFNESDISAVLFSNYKWMNAGFGTGIMLMKTEFLEEFPPKISGMHSYQWENGSPSKPLSMKFYEPGHQNLHGLSILKQVLLARTKEDIREIEARNGKLTSYFLENFESPKVKVVGNFTMDNRSSIVYLDGNEDFYNYLIKNGVVCSFRGNQTRLSFHTEIGNTEKEIDQLIEIIKKY